MRRAPSNSARRRWPAARAASTATRRSGECIRRNLAHARLTTNQRSPSMTPMSPLSIVVVGAGGVGGYFGLRLALAGSAVKFVARGAHAVGGAAYVSAAIESPGVIVHRFGGRIVFGEMDGRVTPRCETLREAIAGAGLPVEISPDVRRVLWEKYLFICAQAGLTALTRCPVGVVRSIPETCRMFRMILDEVPAIARASGVNLAPNVVETLVKQGEALPAELMASLANDVVQGRRLELEALHGHAARLGERFGIPTPAVSAVYAALKPHVDGRPQPVSTT